MRVCVRTRVRACVFACVGGWGGESLRPSAFGTLLDESGHHQRHNQATTALMSPGQRRCEPAQRTVCSWTSLGWKVPSFDRGHLSVPNGRVLPESKSRESIGY